MKETKNQPKNTFYQRILTKTFTKIDFGQGPSSAYLNRIDVQIGDGTVRITTSLTVRAMLTFKKKYPGRARNKSGGQK